jgi:uncharacterized protein YbjT (DUF2867 family)
VIAVSAEWAAHALAEQGVPVTAEVSGADALLLAPIENAPDRVQRSAELVDAARAAGVARVVMLSCVNASPDATYTLARDAWALEEHVRASGIAFTFARMNLQLDFLPWMITPDGEIVGPADDGRAAVVARADVIAAAAALLAADGHDGATYDITGPEALTLPEMVGVLNDVTGRAVTFHNAMANVDAPDWQRRDWMSSFRAIAAGEFAAISGDVKRLTGRDPITLREFLRAGA